MGLQGGPCPCTPHSPSVPEFVGVYWEEGPLTTGKENSQFGLHVEGHGDSPVTGQGRAPLYFRVLPVVVMVADGWSLLVLSTHIHTVQS